LTAASQIIDDPAKAFKTPVSTTGSNKDWQNDAWAMFRLVGELRYYVGWRSSSCSRVELVASEIGDDGLPTGGIAEDNAEGQRVNDIVKAIAGGRLGQSQYVKRAVEHLTIPGETWTVILQRDDGPTAGMWLACSRKEIKRDSRGGVTIKLPSGETHEFNTAKDNMFRIWNPDPEDASEAESPVRACLDPLHEIARTTRKIRNADNSRLIGNGILGIPSEASLPPAQAPVSAGKPGPVDPPPQMTVSQQLQNLIVDVAQQAYEDENSMAGLVPIVVSAPGEHLQKINHIKFGDEVTKIAIETRNDAIARLAMGLDVSPERLLGLASSSNHWSMWAVGDEDVQLHIRPAMETICQAITASVLRVVLAREGIDPDKYVVWYDASKLTADPDKTDEAQKAWETGAIQVSAYLEMVGLPADAAYDLSTPDGLQQWALDQITRNPELITTYAPLIGQLRGIDFPQQSAIESGGDGAEDEEVTNPQQEPDTEGDEPDEGAAVEQSSRTQLAVDLMVTRALELAGKRRRNTHDPAQVQRLRGIAARDTHRVMGPVDAAQIPKLIRGWDEGLDELLARYRLDSDQVRAAVRRHVQRELTREVVDAEAG
jgi:hypothetical protein